MAINNEGEVGINLLNELLSFSSDELYVRLYHLATQSELKKVHLIEKIKEMKIQLKIAQQIDLKYKAKKFMWSQFQCITLASGAAATLIPGVGWVVGGCILAAGLGTFIADYVVEKNNKKKNKEIIKEINEKAHEAKTMAQMLKDRKSDFEKERDRLISFGLQENQASIILILMIFNGKSIFNTNTPLSIEEDNVGSSNYNWWIPSLAVADDTQAQIANFASKIVGNIKISPALIGKFCACLAVVGIAANIYSYSKTCENQSAAVIKIEETIELLEDGKQSIEFFINLFNYLREEINRNSLLKMHLETDARLNFMSVQTNERISELTFQMEQKINQLASISDARINELANHSNNKFMEIKIESDEKIDRLSVETSHKLEVMENKLDSYENRFNNQLINQNRQFMQSMLETNNVTSQKFVEAFHNQGLILQQLTQLFVNAFPIQSQQMLEHSVTQNSSQPIRDTPANEILESENVNDFDLEI